MEKKILRREALALLGAAAGAARRRLRRRERNPDRPVNHDPRKHDAGDRRDEQHRVRRTPSETVGPYPSVTDLFRSDIREDRTGTPLTLTITVVNTNNGCSPVAGANVEIWQCDATGNYSHNGNQTTRTYLRGIQTTNASGQVTFTTIYPG